MEMKLYRCDSAPCRGEYFAATEQPMVCPYCDHVMLYDEPINIEIQVKDKTTGYDVMDVINRAKEFKE